MTSAPQDPGLQPERTYLAWQRTLVLLIVVALLSFAGITTTSPTTQPLVAVLPLVVAMVTTGAIAVAARRRWRSSWGSVEVARPWQVVVLSIAVVGLAVVVSVAALV